MAVGLVATLPSFFFDTYLIKNFPVSFIWWAVFAALLTMLGKRNRQQREEHRRKTEHERSHALRIGAR